MQEIKKLLNIIRAETRPIDGHDDPGAISDCWETVFKKLDEKEEGRNETIR